MKNKIVIIFFICYLVCSCLPKEDLFPYAQDFKKEPPTIAIDKCVAENPQVSRDSCDIKKCFASPVMLLALRELLEEVDKALKKFDIKYWLDSGSAISAYRHFLLPWDDDADLGVLKEDFTPEKRKLVEQELTKQGFLFAPLTSPHWLRGATGVKGLWQVSLGKARFLGLLSRYKPNINFIDADILWEIYKAQNLLYPSLDIFEYAEVEPGKYTYVTDSFPNKWQKIPIDKNILVGLKTANIMGREYPIVEDEKKYFKTVYNTNDMLHDFVIFQDHKPRCEKVRFKDIRKHPEMLDYMFSYLKFVFGPDFDQEKVQKRYQIKS